MKVKELTILYILYTAFSVLRLNSSFFPLSFSLTLTHTNTHALNLQGNLLSNHLFTWRGVFTLRVRVALVGWRLKSTMQGSRGGKGWGG